MMTLLVYLVLTRGFTLETEIVSGLSFYIDPTMLYILVPIKIVYSSLKQNNRVLELLKSLFIWIAI